MRGEAGGETAMISATELALQISQTWKYLVLAPKISKQRKHPLNWKNMQGTELSVNLVKMTQKFLLPSP